MLAFQKIRIVLKHMLSRYLISIVEMQQKSYNESLLPDSLLWPKCLDSQIFTGFTDQDLEKICDCEFGGYDKTLPYKSAAWMYWPAELYSFGRCYREWLGMPSWFPLPIYGDHGVALAGEFSPHEVNSKPKVYLTWNEERAESLKKIAKKRILHCPHPWILFRRKYGLKKKSNARGTLVFLSHTNDGIEISDYSLDHYLEELRSLPDSYKPLVFCIHRHDVDKKYHLKLRKYGFPLVSCGDTCSPYFVERFYSIISHFQYATSNFLGSQLFYCEEFGVAYFLKGDEPVFINYSDKELPLGVLGRDDCADNAHKKADLLFTFPPVASRDKACYVSSILGLTVNFENARNELRKELVNEYISHSPAILLLIFMTFLRHCIDMLKVFLNG